MSESTRRCGSSDGVDTIAEGVEDAETLALVKEYGVNFAPGFHLGRPAPIDR